MKKFFLGLAIIWWMICVIILMSTLPDNPLIVAGVCAFFGGVFLLCAKLTK